MRRSLIALLVAVAAAACGKDTGSTGGGGTPAPQPAKPADPAKDAQWTGTLEALGPSIHMEGTHKLVEAGKVVALLKSAKVELKSYEGKRVTVTGAASATVEGNQTIVDVATVTEAR